MHLIVRDPFGPYVKGDRITSGVQAILAEHAASVIQVAGEEDAPEAIAPSEPQPPEPVAAEPDPEPAADPAPAHSDL